MPTPARAATAAIGAPGAATNTSREASRIRRSLRAAWARLPLRGAWAFSSIQQIIYGTNGSVPLYFLEQNASFHNVHCEPWRKELAVPDANHSAEADDGIRPVPEGYRAVTSWIISRDTARLLDFVKEAFGAEEIARVPNEGGTIGHAEFRIADSIVMAFDAKEGWPDTPGFFRLYVEDGDAVYRRGLEGGGAWVSEKTGPLFGGRVGGGGGPPGNIW